jgi:hypothetical protein
MESSVHYFITTERRETLLANLAAAWRELRDVDPEIEKSLHYQRYEERNGRTTPANGRQQRSERTAPGGAD